MPPTPGHDHGQNTLHLGLSLAGGRGLISLSHPIGCGPLSIEALEMEIPGLRFPADLSGGTRRFRHRRCRLRRATLGLGAAVALEWLTQRLGEAPGFRGVGLGFDGDRFHVTGRLVLEDQGAPFLLRGLFQPAGARVLVRVLDTWVFGPLPLPAPRVAARLLDAAGVGPSPDGDAVFTGCCDVLLDPLALALRWTFPLNGWRLPSRGDARLSRADVTPAGLRLLFEAQEAVVPSRWLSTLAAHDELQRQEALVREDPARALDVYRALLDEGPPNGVRQLVEERLLQLLAVDPERDEETLALAHRALTRDPGLSPALLARGIVLARQGRPDQAAVAYGRVAELCAEQEDRTGETMALLAAGRCAAGTEPARARIDFERVLQIDQRNTTAINQLLRLCADEGNWQRLASLRQRQLALTVAPEQRLHTHLALGEVYRVHLGDPARALTQYGQALEIDPECEPALRGQAETCIDADRATEAIEALRRLCTVLSGRGDREAEVGVRLRIASLHEHLEQHQQALDELQLAQELLPGELQAARQTAAILELLGRKRDAVEALQQLLERESDPAARLSAHIRIAEQWLALDDLEAARTHVKHALSIDPACAAALRLAVSLAERADGPEALVAALERAVEAEEDAPARQDLLLRLARLLAEQTDGAEQAAVALRRAAESGLGAEQLAQAWDRIIGTSQGDPAGAARLQELAAETFVDPGHRAERYFLAGQLLERELERPDSAARCYERALESAPHHGGALDALEAIRAAEGNREELCRILTLKIEAAAWRPTTQKALHCRLGEILTELGRAEEGHVAFTRALSLDADYTPALLHLAREALAGDDADRAERYYRQLIESLSRATAEHTPDERTRLLMEAHMGLAKLHERGGRPQEEEGHLELALSVDPLNPEVLERLDGLLASQGRRAELAEVLRRRADAARDSEHLVELELRRGELLEALPGRVEEAVLAYRRVLRVDPVHAGALERLTHLLREGRRFGELLEVLGQRAELAEENGREPDHVRRLWLESAAVASSRLGDPERAARLLHRALRGAPGDPEVVDAILRLQPQAGPPPDIDPHALLDIAHRHREAGQMDRAVRALRAAVRSAQTASLRSAAARALLDALEAADTRSADDDLILALSALDELQASAGERWQLACLLVARGDEERAVEVLQRLLDTPDRAGDGGDQPHAAAFPDPERAHQLLQGCLGRLGRHREQAEATERRAAEPQASPRQRVAALTTAAALWAERVGEIGRAEAALRQAAAVEPLDIDLVERAADLLRDEDRFAAFVSSLTERDGTHSPATQARVLCRAAEVTRLRHGAPKAVERLLRDALDRDPRSGDAHERLIELLSQRGDDERLADALVARAEVGAEVGPRVGALLQAADLLADRLGRLEEAVALVERAAGLRPEDPAILERRVDLELLRGACDAAERLLVQLADRGHHPERCMTRALGLAQLREDATAQLSHLRRLAHLRPADRSRLAALASALAASGDLEGQAAVLDQLAIDDPTLLLELAQLRSGPLGQPHAALDTISRLLAEQPDNRPALVLLAQLCRELERPAEEASALRRLHAIEPGALRRAETAAAVARLERRTGNRAGAIEAWLLALRDAPGDAALLRELGHDLRRQGRWLDLSEVLEQTLERELPDDASARCELAAEVGEIHLDRLGDPKTGIEWLRRAWALCIGSGAGEREDVTDRVYQRLARLHRERREHAELARLMEQSCVRLAGDSLATRLEELAWLQEHQIRDLHAAGEAYVAAFHARRDPARALRAQDLLVRTNDLDGALALVNDALPRATGEERGKLHACRGRILTIRGMMSEAVAEYERALEHHPGLHNTRAELGRRLFEQGLFDAAVPHLEMAARSVDLPTEREACAFLAQRAREKLGVLTRAEADEAATGPTGRPVTRELHTEQTSGSPSPTAPEVPALEAGPPPTTPREWESLAGSYRARAAACASPQDRAGLLLMAAEIIEDQLNRPLEAYKVFEEAASASPGLMRATEALADAAYRSQNWHRARELYDEIWRAEPARPRHDVAYRRGLVHETLGDYQTADLCYSHAITIDPDDRASLEGKARVALARDDIPGAVGALQGLAKLITVDEVEELGATRCKLGELHLRAGDHPAARACLESVLSLDPNHAKAIQTLLAVYEQIGEFEGMASLLERLVRLTSNPLVRASLLHYRAEVLGGELGNEEAAVDCLLKAYDLAPNYPPTLWRLIDYYWERDDLPAVAEMGANLRRSTDLSSATPDVRHVRLAVVAFVEEKKPQVGADLLGVALEKADLHRQVLQELGRAVDKGATAEEVLALLRRTDPENKLGETLVQVAVDHPENRGLAALARLAGQPSP